ncbi:MAG: superoxide dismutase [Oscillospiraceae bacterium]|nr:superoxide dismutase [Oscillospiraceae bacterium]
MNTPLAYAYDALEPYIDAQTMVLHHDRHLQTYVDNLNAALQPYPWLQTLSLQQLLRASTHLPMTIATPVARNAGGVYNHRLYFDGLTPESAPLPDGALSSAIVRRFGSISQFREQLTQAAAGVFGSGYAWLCADRRGTLSIVTTANQETPQGLCLCPILNLDVWEHAYYLKHFNKRADYLTDWFHVVNWPAAEARYLQCKEQSADSYFENHENF